MNHFARLFVAVLCIVAYWGSAVAASPPGIDDTSHASDDGTRTLRQSVIVVCTDRCGMDMRSRRPTVIGRGPRRWRGSTFASAASSRPATRRTRNWARRATSATRSSPMRRNACSRSGESAGAAGRAVRRADVPVAAHGGAVRRSRWRTRTRVTIVQPGYRAGDAYDRTWKFFEWGNGATLAALRDRFVNGPTDWRKLRRNDAGTRLGVTHRRALFRALPRGRRPGRP